MFAKCLKDPSQPWCIARMYREIRHFQLCYLRVFILKVISLIVGRTTNTVTPLRGAHWVSWFFIILIFIAYIWFWVLSSFIYLLIGSLFGRSSLMLFGFSVFIEFSRSCCYSLGFRFYKFLCFFFFFYNMSISTDSIYLTMCY